MDKYKEHEEQQEYINNVDYRINVEGFDFTFDGFSDWEIIKDEKFHKLRKKYLEVKNELQKYVDKKQNRR